jgi:hypothetical protein
MSKTFVYTELQAAIPFHDVPWRSMNPMLKQLPGLVGKTWLSGVGSNSVGGFYEFSSREAARDFADNVFPREAAQMGASFTTRLFDGDVTEEASRELASAHYR